MKLKKLINSIKRYFKKNNMSYDFENIKVKALEDKINLKENATTDGKNNIPRSNSENFSFVLSWNSRLSKKSTLFKDIR